MKPRDPFDDPSTPPANEFAIHRNPTAFAGDVAAFETRFRVSLPADYRAHILGVSNGGSYGPEYGLLPLGFVPEHWRRSHNYSERLSRPWPITNEWVWEDEPDTPDLNARLARIDDGALLLGEEGCGARWVLVLIGACAGEVWLCTGEGATPCRPRLGFSDWLRARTVGGLGWWAEFVSGWGPRRNIWFAAHAAKQLCVSHVERTPTAPLSMEQSNPLCRDCRAFLSKIAVFHRLRIQVVAPRLIWFFDTEGHISSAPSPTEPGNAA